MHVIGPSGPTIVVICVRGRFQSETLARKFRQSQTKVYFFAAFFRARFLRFLIRSFASSFSTSDLGTATTARNNLSNLSNGVPSLSGAGSAGADFIVFNDSPFSYRLSVQKKRRAV